MRTYSTGDAIQLREVLAQSGQGTVYLTDRPGYLAKLYSSNDDLGRFEKLKVMTEMPPADPTWETLRHLSIAWPVDLLLKESRCVGFLMPHIQGARELTHVYNPVLRTRHSPKFNWYYLHSAAFNYVSALEAIHAKGYVIGDIKPQNVLVTPRALIAIIDTDSFQVVNPESGMKYRCPVGSEGFTPPELLLQLAGRKFTDVDRTEIHDRFGMAVIVYLLLFGRHPFSEGKWLGGGDPPSPDDRVTRGLWLQNPGGEIGRDPGTIPLSIVHPRIEQCFRRCFIDGFSEPLMRPAAGEWKQALKSALEDLAPCATESNHHYSMTFGSCYWCNRKQALGIDIFSPHTRIPPKAPPPLIRLRTVTAGSLLPGTRMLPRTLILNAARFARFATPARLVAVAMGVIVANLFGFYLMPVPKTVPPMPPMPVTIELRTSFMEPWSAALPKISQSAKTALFNEISAPVRELIDAGGIRTKGGYVFNLFMVYRLGTEAPKGKNALMVVSYPEKYDVTGRETYIEINGAVYAKDLGPRTNAIVEHLDEIKIDATWLKVN